MDLISSAQECVLAEVRDRDPIGGDISVVICEPFDPKAKSLIVPESLILSWVLRGRSFVPSDITATRLVVPFVAICMPDPKTIIMQVNDLKFIKSSRYTWSYESGASLVERCVL